MRSAREGERWGPAPLPRYWNRSALLPGAGCRERKAKPMREIVTLQCTTCKKRNYSTTKNKKKTPARLEIKKFCRACRGHRVHRETR